MRQGDLCAHRLELHTVDDIHIGCRAEERIFATHLAGQLPDFSSQIVVYCSVLLAKWRRKTESGSTPSSEMKEGTSCLEMMRPPSLRTVIWMSATRSRWLAGLMRRTESVVLPSGRIHSSS